MYAITPNPLGWRIINNASECIPGEVFASTLPDGINAANAVWDASMNTGAGGIRVMTPVEAAAVLSTQTSLATGANQAVQSIHSLLGIMTVNGSNPPFVALNAVQQTSFNVAVGRAMLYLMRGSLS